MQYHNLHSWHVTTDEARQLQEKLRNQVIQKDRFAEIRTVAGVDLGIKNDISLASVVVLNYPNLQIVDGVVAESRVNFPYIPGYLSFREIPPLLVAFARLKTEPPTLRTSKASELL